MPFSLRISHTSSFLDGKTLKHMKSHFLIIYEFDECSASSLIEAFAINNYSPRMA